jgi:hypothetical protein
LSLFRSADPTRHEALQGRLSEPDGREDCDGEDEERGRRGEAPCSQGGRAESERGDQGRALAEAADESLR